MLLTKIKEYIKSQNQKGRLLIVRMVGVKVEKQITIAVDYFGGDCK